MWHPSPKHIKLSPKALSDLKEALYQEIGNYASEYSEEDLHRLGSFVLKVVAISSKLKLGQLKKERLKQ